MGLAHHGKLLKNSRGRLFHIFLVGRAHPTIKPRLKKGDPAGRPYGDDQILVAAGFSLRFNMGHGVNFALLHRLEACATKSLLRIP